MLSQIFATNSDWVPTLVRIVLGIIFFAHGAQKMLGWYHLLAIALAIVTIVKGAGVLSLDHFLYVRMGA